ncbi:MAG: GNAT family N-acetyltransferase [Acidobacteriota bacterium]
MRIRPATPADRARALEWCGRLAEFDVPAWRTAGEVIDGDARAVAAWFDDPDRPDEAMLIAELDGRPVGVIYLLAPVDYFSGRPHGHVSVLAVAREAEGRGVGSALLEAAAAWSRARGCDRLTIMVFAGNRRARAVYEKNGFVPEFVRYARTL